MRPVPHDHTHLWNDLPFSERKRLLPYAMESQILHLEQAREVLVRNHAACLKELDGWINNIKDAIRRETE